MTTPRAEPAPIFTDTFALCTWLLGRLGDDARVLARRSCETALALLDAVVLALKDRERARRLVQADDHLLRLRMYLRLAGATDLLSEDQMLHALEAADGIGRQLGGWQRHQDQAS
jgi:hypothetical protein